MPTIAQLQAHNNLTYNFTETDITIVLNCLQRRDKTSIDQNITLGALEDEDVAVDVLAAILPKHRVPSLYQRPAALRGARLAVRHAVAEAARSPYFDLSAAERLLHGEREPRLGRRRRRRDREELVEAP